jgi:hypothetical protein
VHKDEQATWVLAATAGNAVAIAVAVVGVWTCWPSHPHHACDQVFVEQESCGGIIIIATATATTLR